MKLAEALLQRKELLTKVNQLGSRILQDALVQEGDEPAENPLELLAEQQSAIKELESIITRINKTNITNEIERGITIADAIVKRDMLNLRRGTLERLANQANITQSRMTKSEIKFVATVDVKEIRKECDAVSKQIRELDAEIQAANWNVELVE